MGREIDRKTFTQATFRALWVKVFFIVRICGHAATDSREVNIMKCPVCQETNLVMSERQGIEIDYCPGCRGVWLDRGELDKIIERSKPQGASAEPARQPAPHHHDQDHYKKQGHGYGYVHGYHHKKKKSFFEELFD